MAIVRPDALEVPAFRLAAGAVAAGSVPLAGFATGGEGQVKTAAVVVTLVSAALIACLAVYVGRRRRVAGGLPLMVVLAAGAFGYGAYAMELWMTGPARQTWGDLKYPAVVVLPLAFLAFNLAYTGSRGWLTLRRCTLLAALPVAVLVLVAIPATHNWVRYYPPGQLDARFGTARLGPAGYVFVAYSATVVVAAAGITIVKLVRISRLYRRQVAVLSAGIAVPWLINLLFDFNVGPFAYFDPTAEAFLLAGVIMVWGVFRFRLMDLAPLAIATVVKQMPEAVVILDAYGRVVDLNPAGEALLLTTKSENVGRLLNELLDWPGDLLRLTQTTTEITVTHCSGVRDFEATVTPLSAGPGRLPGGHLVVLRDITDRKAVQTQLERMAHHDTLTGLPNRIFFDGRFGQALAAARRHVQPLAVLYLDLDGFKRINDIFGHAEGDSVLRDCAQRLVGALRGDDIVSRMGGDEFVVLLGHVDNTEGALATATKLLASLATPMPIAGTRVRLTASIGIALWPEHGVDQRALLRAADDAMYLSKRRGGDQATLATASSRQGERPLALGDELLHGLKSQELHAFFQPVVTLAGRPAIMEAELRWRHPHDGLLRPADFQTAANQAGLQRPLRRLVLSEACYNTVEWDRRLGRHLAVSVRLDRRDLTDTVLAEDVESVLSPNAVDGRRLIVEFVDGRSQAERDALLPGLLALKEHHVRLSLDNFGSGQTPTARLLRLPLDQVKLDSNLVDEAAVDVRARRVLSRTIELARDLELSVVGRGHEGTDQFRVLRDLGCDLILRRTHQEPLSPTAAMAWLRSA